MSNATSPQSSTLVPTRADLQLSAYTPGTSDPNKTTSDTYAPQTTGIVLSNSSLYSTKADAPLTVIGGISSQKITVPTKAAVITRPAVKKTVNWPLFGASLLLVAVALYILMRTGNKQHKKALLKR